MDVDMTGAALSGPSSGMDAARSYLVSPVMQTRIQAAAPSAPLADRIHAGDRRAEAELVSRYRRGLVLMLTRRCGDAFLAEDVAHDALFRVIERLRDRPLDAPDGLDAYVHATAKHMATGTLRKDARRRTDPDLDAVLEAHANDEAQWSRVFREEMWSRIESVIGELSGRDQRILRGLLFEMKDKETMLRELGIAAAAYDVAVHRAKARLLQRLEALLG